MFNSRHHKSCDKSIAMNLLEDETSDQGNAQAEKEEHNSKVPTNNETGKEGVTKIVKENRDLKREVSVKERDADNVKAMMVRLVTEKEMLANELALKNRVLAETEEHLKDVKAQNEALASRLGNYAKETKAKMRNCQGVISSLQNRNKELSEQLLKSSDGCRILKNKCRELYEQNKGFVAEIAGLKEKVIKSQKMCSDLQKEKEILQDQMEKMKGDGGVKNVGQDEMHKLEEELRFLT